MRHRKSLGGGATETNEREVEENRGGDDEYGDDYDRPGKVGEGEKKSQERNRRHSRHVLGQFDILSGNQLPDVSYCDKNKYYTGKHAACFRAMTEFFAQDVALLHSNLTVR